MANNIISIHEIDQYNKFLGNKTLNLKKCVDWGYDVPKFVAISSNVVEKLFINEVERKKTAQQAVELLRCARYVVRSSALVEDDDKQSYAGQFTTKVNLAEDKLGQGIFDVISQAKELLRGDFSKFSLIIQEYIFSDIAGVTFTRSPNGGREMVIEYGRGAGEIIVSGATRPSAISFYWHEQNRVMPETRITDRMIEIFKEIEKKNNFPQDIEWCVKDKQFYVLQTRPVTTITKLQYEQARYLDDVLPKGKKYLYEKTEISEIAPRPATATLDLLKRIYSDKGPVDNVYKRHGVIFRNTDFLKIIGNELFIDREKEIKGLLPGYSYLHKTNLIPKFSVFTKTIPTIKNILSLNKIKTYKYEQLFRDIKTKIESPQQETNIEISLKIFLSDYETVFEANLLSGLALKKLTILLKNEPIRTHQILCEYALFADMTRFQVDYPTSAKGNTIELSDETDFMASDVVKNKTTAEISQWWQAMSSLKKKRLQKIITEAIIYSRLREYGRWLALKNISVLRSALLRAADEKGFADKKNIYFAPLSDVIKNRVTESSCAEIKTTYDKYSQYNLPARLTHKYIVNPVVVIGVSPGLASGILQDQKFIEQVEPKERKYILYTEILHPELTKYFDRVAGVVSNNGGILSHLAIIAREKNIPVIVGFNLARSLVKLGDHVQIDGASGKIEVIKPLS